MLKFFRKFFLFFCSFFICYSTFASANIDFIRKAIKGKDTVRENFEHLEFQYDKNKKLSEIYEINNVGHFFVTNKNTGKKYDSATGEGSVLRQYYADCLFHATDNFFWLETFNGKLPYSPFSKKMRYDLNMYLFYFFAVSYSRLASGKVIAGFTDYYIDNSIILNYSGFSNFFDKNSVPNNVISIIADEANLTAAERNTKEGFIKMLRYIYTDMKHKMGLSGDFSFEKDTPHLLWIFKDGLGYTDKEVEDILEQYLNNFIKNHLKNCFRFLLYNNDINQKNTIENIIILNRTTNGFNFYLDYNNDMSFHKKYNYNKVIDNISFSAIYEHKIYRNFRFDILFDYNRDENLYNDINVKINTITTGFGLKKLYNYDKKSNFNLGVLINFKINSGDKILENEQEFDFSNNNIIVFFQDYRNIKINTFLLTSIDFSSTFNYTNYSYYNLKSDYFYINNINYNIFSLNFDLNFIKSFQPIENITSDIIFNFKLFNYFNRPKMKYKSISLENNNEEMYNVWFGLKFNVRIKKFLEFNVNFSKNVITDNYIFLGAGISVKF